jgi:hypothetical protein
MASVCKDGGACTELSAVTWPIADKVNTVGYIALATSRHSQTQSAPLLPIDEASRIVASRIDLRRARYQRAKNAMALRERAGRTERPHASVLHQAHVN